MPSIGLWKNTRDHETLHERDQSLGRTGNERADRDEAVDEHASHGSRTERAFGALRGRGDFPDSQ
jgi:hypothetical protein